ncbi:MAG: hypothetical protein QXM12_07285 [Nitrososphaerota archaeon]
MGAYSALNKLTSGIYAYTLFGSTVGKQEAVGYAVIGGTLYSLFELSPETEGLPKIVLKPQHHRKLTLNVEDLSPIHLVNRLALPPISLQTIMVQAWDSQRDEYLTTIFPANNEELTNLIRWCKGRYRKVSVGAADYELL